MSTRFLKIAAVTVVTACLQLSAGSAQACLPWLFGSPCYRPYAMPQPAAPFRAGCGPCQPVFRPLWAPMAWPGACNSCFTCGPNGCADGSCGLATIKPKPESKNEVPSTFAEDGEGDVTAPTDGFVPVDDGESETEENVEAFVPPRTNLDETEGAPITDPIEENNNPLEDDGFQLRPAPDEGDVEAPKGLEGLEPGEQGQLKLERSEGNIAWRVVPKRTRLVRRAARTVTLPRTIRHNDGWTPIDEKSLLVTK